MVAQVADRIEPALGGVVPGEGQAPPAVIGSRVAPAHVVQYIDRGEVTVEVTQKWTGRWSAGGESGVIADRLATSATRTIKVEEIQAVITG